VGEVAGSRSPAPTIEELLARMERKPPAAQGSTEPTDAAAEEAAATEALEEAPARRDWSTSPVSSAPQP
jgi:hypothetical protein